jgi:hypothetical protein
MKKIFLLTTLFFITLFVQAQENESYWGIKLGLNVSEIQSKNEANFDLGSTTGIHGEVYRNFRLNKAFAIQAGLAYTEKGGKDKPESWTNNFDERFDINTTYLSLPVVFQTRSGNFFSELGFAPAIQLASKANVTDPSFNEAILASVWESDYDLGFVVGVGYHINNLEINLRAIPGLVKVSSEIAQTDQNGALLSEKRYGRNMLIQMSAGYRIN